MNNLTPEQKQALRISQWSIGTVVIIDESRENPGTQYQITNKENCDGIATITLNSVTDGSQIKLELVSNEDIHDMVQECFCDFPNKWSCKVSFYTDYRG